MDYLTYIPTGRMGWWGGPDTRRRCNITDKVVLTQQEAERKAEQIRIVGRFKGDEHMTAYKCGRCQRWHVGHRQRGGNRRRKD